MGGRLTVLAVFGCVTAIMAALMAGVLGAAQAAEDRKPPTVAGVSPAADSTTPDATPEIAATVRDGKTNLAKKHIRLFVDGAGTGAFSYDRATDRLSHTPEATLAEGGHTVRIVAKDAAGNVGRKAWTFSIGAPLDTTAPTIDTVSPAEGATGVAPSTDVAATFSEAMDPTSISGQTFLLVEQGTSSPVAATVSYDPTGKRATLDPGTNLAPSTTYEATLTTGVEDAAGNALAQERSWAFTTAEAPTGVTVTPATLDLTPSFWCEQTSKFLTVTNNGPGDVTFAQASITGPDAGFFSTGSQSYIATNGPFTVQAGNFFEDGVGFRAGPTAADRLRNYSATLTYKDGTGATIGTPVTLTAKPRCLNV